MLSVRVCAVIQTAIYKFSVFDDYIHVSTKEERLMRETNEKQAKGERATNGVNCGVVASRMASLTSHCEGFLSDLHLANHRNTHISTQRHTHPP